MGDDRSASELAAFWLKSAAAVRLPADASPLVEFMAARQAAAATSMAASLVALAEARRADVAVERLAGGARDATWETSGPGEREYAPGRPATETELHAAPSGTEARVGKRTWIRVDRGQPYQWLSLDDRDDDCASRWLVGQGARITGVLTPVGQTPAGPVGAVATPPADLTLWTTAAAVDALLSGFYPSRSLLPDGHMGGVNAELRDRARRALTALGRHFGAQPASVGPVPLASADLLPNDAFDEIFRSIYSYRDDVTAPQTWCQTMRHITDAVNAKLRAQFPDETPTEPEQSAPFVRGVDELTDDEFWAIRQETIPARWPGTLVGHEQVVRDVAAAIAVRLRVDVPRREAETDEITAHTLNAAKIGATVRDSENEPWKKTGPEHWTCECRAHLDCLSDRLVDSFGPLRDLREPAEITAAMLDAAVVGAKVTARGATRDLLADWVKLHDDSWRCPGLRHSAARLVADFGPLSNLRPPSEPETGGAAFDGNEREAWGDDPTGPAGPVLAVDDSRRELIRAVFLAAAGRVEDEMGRETGVPLAWARSDVDKAALAHVAALHGPTVGADVLSIARVLTDDTIGTGGYEPAALTVGSVVQSGSTVWICAEGEGRRARWLRVDADGFRWVDDIHVSLDGVFVVDGATLGGQR